MTASVSTGTPKGLRDLLHPQLLAPRGPRRRDRERRLAGAARLRHPRRGDLHVPVLPEPRLDRVRHDTHRSRWRTASCGSAPFPEASRRARRTRCTARSTRARTTRRRWCCATSSSRRSGSATRPATGPTARTPRAHRGPLRERHPGVARPGPVSGQRPRRVPAHPDPAVYEDAVADWKARHGVVAEDDVDMDRMLAPAPVGPARPKRGPWRTSNHRGGLVAVPEAVTPSGCAGSAQPGRGAVRRAPGRRRVVLPLEEQRHAAPVRVGRERSRPPRGPAGPPTFLAVLAALGFKQARPQRRGRQVPGVVHYYGLDQPTGTLVHVDAQAQLVLGDDTTKNVRLPIERAYLASCTAGPALPRPGTGVRARGAGRAAGPQARHLGRGRVRAGAAACCGAPRARVPRRTGRSRSAATGRGRPPAADRLGRLVAVLPRTAGRRCPPHVPGGRARRRPRRRRPDAPPSRRRHRPALRPAGGVGRPARRARPAQHQAAGGRGQRDRRRRRRRCGQVHDGERAVRLAERPVRHARRPHGQAPTRPGEPGREGRHPGRPPRGAAAETGCPTTPRRQSTAAATPATRGCCGSWSPPPTDGGSIGGSGGWPGGAPWWSATASRSTRSL